MSDLMSPLLIPPRLQAATLARLTALAVFMPMLNRVPTAQQPPAGCPKIIWDASCTRLIQPGLQSFSAIGAACGSHLPGQWARTSRVQRAPAQVVWPAERV